MTLVRLTNYVDGNVLTGAQLNNEFDNILNNGPALISASIPSYSAVSGLTGSIISNIGSFAANAYQLKSTTTICSLTATSSYSINTQTAGPIANGRDQAAVFASTQVHFYAITTGGTSTNAAGICSTRPPNIGPTLPAGYSAWTYLASAIYSTLSSAISIPLGLNICGGQAYLVSSTNAELLSSGTAGTPTDVGCGAFVPTVVPSWTMQLHGIGGIVSAAGAGVSLNVNLYAASTSATRWQTMDIRTPSTTAGATVDSFVMHVVMPNVRTTPEFGYSIGVASGTSGHMSARLVSYSLPNGDVS